MASTEHDADEAMVRTTIRSVVADAGERPVVEALDELGWAELMAQDEQLAVSTLFEEQARGLAPSAALDDVLRRAAGLGGGRVVLPLGGSQPSSLLEGRTLRLDGLLLAARGPGDVRELVVPARRADGVAFVRLPSPVGLEVRPIEGIDPTLALARVMGEVPAVAVDHDDGAARWEQALLAGRRALASELVAAAQVLLDLASDHARTRIQFKVPIGAHQGIKFPLADVFVAISAARCCIGEAWEAPSIDASALAKAAAGSAGLLAIEHCHQAMGAMGFTWEFPMHHSTRRVYAIDALLGDTAALDRERGVRLLRSGTAPRIGDL